MKYIIANWKMNSIDIEEWFKGFNKFFREIKNDVEVIVCPSYVDIVKCSQQAPNLIMAAQDVSIHDDGPFTGQISALQLSRTSEQLKYCLLGHSEVRSKGDTNSLIRIKSKKLEAYKINSILCVGEDENVLNEGEREKFLLDQLDSYFQEGLCPKFIAYEPIWAIGTGVPADKKNIDDALKIISIFLKEKKQEKIPLLYGGSVSSKNIDEIMSSELLSGCLVGNASLDGEEFARIAKNFRRC